VPGHVVRADGEPADVPLLEVGDAARDARRARGVALAGHHVERGEQPLERAVAARVVKVPVRAQERHDVEPAVNGSLVYGMPVRGEARTCK
jgi:hypothetical protein